MKQLVSSLQMANLSPIAKQRWHDWCKQKEYGTTIDGEYIPTVQPSIGLLIEFLDDQLGEVASGDGVYNPDGYQGIVLDDGSVSIVWYKDKELIDLLFDGVKEILEQKN